MEALIWIDWVIIALIAVSTLISLKRGFVREALSLELVLPVNQIDSHSSAFVAGD